MDKRNYYFDQVVEEVDMRDLEDRAEGGDKRAVTDLMKGQMLVTGLVGTQNSVPDLNVLISAGIAYDVNGDRINIPSQQTFNLSTYLPTDDEVWVTVSAKFIRVLSNEVVDGYGNTVYYDNDESFEIVITKGEEAGSGNVVKPAIPSGQVSLFDIKLVNGMTQIANADINTVRRHNNRIFRHTHEASILPYSNSVSGLLATTVQDAIDELQSHIEGQDEAAEIGYDNGDSGLDADNVQDALDELETHIDEVANSVAADAAIPPIGSIIPFYDFNGALAFNTDNWAYCNGQTKTVEGIGPQALPDLSNRYLVGFGTEGASDIGSAIWNVDPVGIAGHAISLVHSHTVNSHAHSVPDHTHSTPAHTHTINSHSHSTPAHTHSINSHTHSTPNHSHGVNAHSHSVSDHSHGPGSLQFEVFAFGQGSGNNPLSVDYYAWNISGTQFQILDGNASNAGGVSGQLGTSITSIIPTVGGGSFYTRGSTGSTAGSGTLSTSSDGSSTDSSGGSTTGGSGTLSTNGGEGGSSTGGSGTLTTNSGEGGSSTGGSGALTSGTASPGTDNQLSGSQSIQPRSVRVRFIMRIA